jgi:ATPase subunit of ABC transporter with duplicated ATPase domains
MKSIKSFLKFLGIVVYGIVVLLGSLIGMVFLEDAHIIEMDGETIAIAVGIIFFSAMLIPFFIYKIFFTKTWKSDLKQFAKENFTSTEEERQRIENHRKEREQKDREEQEKQNERNREWQRKRQIENDEKERNEKREQEEKKLISHVVQEGNFVKVYNKDDRRLFERQGILKGYTSTSVSVQNGNSIDTYDNNDRRISKKNCV